LPIFSVTDDISFDDWFAAFNGAKNILKLSEEEQSLICYGHITGKPLQVFINALTGEKPVDEALKQVQDIFGQPESSINALKKLNNLKQNDHPVAIILRKL
jgi:hypothetical protein